MGETKKNATKQLLAILKESFADSFENGMAHCDKSVNFQHRYFKVD